ncbi:DNA/RNA non-specific endonuclease [Paracrocinitomix mangrovi]|uniref:DNA/RNA non-specific endonuclease n=1 Tax=Paracrocinitomix mangrovi TaxID=2862509 RepID=UPI001C8DB651|nr:DNA/RNA non-specific endonuclease [Paracrocinitomix mangrovi]UKN01245.1 DNA/RNA non-specific endonuclease [Paracrocinitomix mangrovi]
MKTKIWIFFGLFLLSNLAFSQDPDCKKLTGKTGGTGNKCCKTDAAKADEVLLSAHQNSKDSLIKVHAPFGLPKSKNPNIILLYSPGYICGYDTVTKIPIWVQYKMWNNNQWDKNIKRTNCFRPDPRLEKEQRITYHDYTNSGFDRGHIKPANDAKLNLSEHYNSFVMTNMAPQYGHMNQQEWKTIESYLNGISRKDSIKVAYMITGSVMSDKPAFIKSGKVAIPDAFYKIFFFKTTSGNWHYWRFYVTNDDIKVDIRKFESELIDNDKTIDEIEALTETNFFVCRKKQKKVEAEKSHSFLYDGMFHQGYSSDYSN